MKLVRFGVIVIAVVISVPLFAIILPEESNVLMLKELVVAVVLGFLRPPMVTLNAVSTLVYELENPPVILMELPDDVHVPVTPLIVQGLIVLTSEICEGSVTSTNPPEGIFTMGVIDIVYVEGSL